jgi:hydrogenase maturation protease
MSPLQASISEPVEPLVDSNVTTLVIGCGNLLRGDDAVGPVLIRRLWQRGLPAGVRCADGGTGGMDVAFQMRGVPHVIVVDAANTGAKPGTRYEVPGDEIASLPPLSGIHPHAFRWDHALAFGRWLLKDDYPSRITVYLIEGASFGIGDELSEVVDASVDCLVEHLLQILGQPSPADAFVELTPSGYLQLHKEVAQRYFPEDVLVAFYRNGCLTLLPTRGAAAGGLMLKQRNARGDRCLLLSEVFHFSMPTGTFAAVWNHRAGSLEVRLPEQRSVDR